MTKNFSTRYELLEYSLSQAGPGNAVEFGVGDGTTLRVIASHRPEKTYGFDSFTGLPEPWRPGFPTGAFAGPPPQIDHAKLVIGLFEETVPSQLPKDIAFIHIDCDLYSSTKTVLNAFPLLKTGTIIQFDELFGYPGWVDHEFKALIEWLSCSGVRLRPIGYVSNSEQVSFRVDGAA